jgi:hypothetical protein
MIGCLILGTFGAFFVAKLIRHRMGWACHGAYRHHFHHDHHDHHGHHGHWGGWEAGGWGHHGYGWEGGDYGDTRGWRRGRGHGREYVISTVLDRIGATPVQERTIRAAFEELRAEAKRAGGGQFKELRQDIASALRKPAFDEVLLGELFARHDRAIEDVRKAFVGFMAKTHDALDEEQRARLADLIDRGPRFWRSGFGW